MIEFLDNFDLMYSCVMARCNRELIRESTQDGSTKVCFIFYSYSGVTKCIAEGIRYASGCDLIEVTTKKPYSSFSAYKTGVLRSRKLVCDPIEPDWIDVTDYDLIIIGTPVWAWRPAPAMNAAVQALSGCEGKRVVICTTCCNQPGEAIPILRNALTSCGAQVVAEMALTAEDTRHPDAGGELLKRIIQAEKIGRDSIQNSGAHT